MLNITEADAHIALYSIDPEDWADSDEAKKTRLLNIADRTLTRKFSKYVVPNEAVYEFAAHLAAVFNDTNKMQRYGIKQFSLKSISFTFEGANKELADLIPQSVTDLISDANGGISPVTRRIGRSVR